MALTPTAVLHALSFTSLSCDKPLFDVVFKEVEVFQTAGQNMSLKNTALLMRRCGVNDCVVSEALRKILVCDCVFETSFEWAACRVRRSVAM
jgi:hypothetical protein